MRAYRLCKSRWASTAFSGEGALRYAGRWHFAGTPIVYTATSRSLAALEILVHMEIRHAAPDFTIIPVEIPEDLIQNLDELPAGWDDLPAGEASRRVGTEWARARTSVALEVPSAVVRRERNVLVNPFHPDFEKVEICPTEPFVFDPRLISQED